MNQGNCAWAYVTEIKWNLHASSQKYRTKQKKPMWMRLHLNLSFLIETSDDCIAMLIAIASNKMSLEKSNDIDEGRVCVLRRSMLHLYKGERRKKSRRKQASEWVYKQNYVNMTITSRKNSLIYLIARDPFSLVPSTLKDQPQIGNFNIEISRLHSKVLDCIAFACNKHGGEHEYDNCVCACSQMDHCCFRFALMHGIEWVGIYTVWANLKTTQTKCNNFLTHVNIQTFEGVYKHLYRAKWEWKTHRLSTYEHSALVCRCKCALNVCVNEVNSENCIQIYLRSVDVSHPQLNKMGTEQK